MMYKGNNVSPLIFFKSIQAEVKHMDSSLWKPNVNEAPSLASDPTELILPLTIWICAIQMTFCISATHGASVSM